MPPELDGRIAALEALRAKYLELCAMREERERLEARGVMRFEGEALSARSARGRALAIRFPGVLRELDHCDVGTLCARLSDVEAQLAALRAGAPEPEAPSWIGVMMDFHALWRDGLSVRRWLRQRGGDRSAPDAVVVAELRRFLQGSPGTAVRIDSIDGALLAETFAPGRGSIAAWVWDEIARRHDVTAAEARALVFPEPPSTGAEPG